MTRLASGGPGVGVPVQGGAGDVLLRAWEDAVGLAEADSERLADELHSGLLQALVVARHAVGRAGGAGDGLPGADDAVRDCLAEARRTVWHLRPRALGLGALPGAVEELAARVGDDGGVTLAAQVTVRRSLSPARASVAYRLVQALVRAAGAAGGSALRVDVADDAYGAVVVRHDASPAVHDVVVSSPWARRGDALSVRVERRP